MSSNKNLKEMNESEINLLEEFRNISEYQNIYKYAVHLEELENYYLLTKDWGYKILCTKDKKYNTDWTREINITESNIEITLHYNTKEKNYYSLDLKCSTGFSDKIKFKGEYIFVEKEGIVKMYNKAIKLMAGEEVKNKSLIKN